MRSGYEPTVRLLTEAACWQLADAAVRQHDSPAMRAFPLEPGQRDRGRAGPRRRAGRAPARPRRRRAGSPSASPRRSRAASAPRMLKPVQDVLDRQRGRLALLPLVEAYAERKRAMEAMDFGDQLRRAAVGGPRPPRGGRRPSGTGSGSCCSTSTRTPPQAQLVLLRSLFGDGHPVTAVGDPCQSIYGWRGASAGTLDRFPRDVPAGRRRAGRHPSPHRQLAQRAAASSTSPTRSPTRCAATGAPVKPLRAAEHVRAQDVADPPVRCAFAAVVPGRGGVDRRRGRRRPGASGQARDGACARPRPCWCGPGRRSRRSSGRCASAACRSRWSASAVCSTPRRCATSSAPCRCWPTRPPARRCCACSPAPAGASGRATSSPSTAGPARSPGSAATGRDRAGDRAGPARSRSRTSAASVSTTPPWPRRSTTSVRPTMYSAEG